jgi:hypothetical protein
MRPILISTAALALAGLGCGGDDEKTSSSSSAATNTTPQAVAPPPAELLGTYTTTLKRSDVPDPAPPELDGQFRWTLRITKDGGPDDKPALTIVKPPDDVLESSAMAVTGDKLELTGEECAQTMGDSIVSSSYTWKAEGDHLRLTAVKHGCADKVAETILSAEPWKRAG